MDDSRTRRAGAQADVIAADRAFDAHQLRLAGQDWTLIADRVGYLDGKVAATAVNAYLQKAAVAQSGQQRRHALELELARLDHIQAAYYPAAIAGDLGAANLVLKIIARRCAIMGFDKPDDTNEPPRTILIGGTTEEYVAGLKAVVEGTHPGLAPQ